MDYCEKLANEKKSEFDELMKLPSPPGIKVCNMISGYMIGCMNGQLYLNCPKDKVGADPACGKIKDFVTKCGFLYPCPPKN